jgi:LysR family hydrogen peroxide-inducible transcriptional activator
VADAGSFSAAARRLHTVQSNVSTHVARLERELGAMLVDRSSGELTDEGEVAVGRARRIHHELEALRADIDSMLHQVSGPVRLGCIGTVGRWLVPRLLEHMAERHPLVSVVVVDATTTSLVPQVVSDSLDLAVVNVPVPARELATEPLFDEERIVLAPQGHPLAARDRVTLDDLTEHPLLLEPRGTAFRDELDDEMARSGLTLRAQAEIDGIRLLTSLAFEGFGAAVVPATAAPLWYEATCRRRGRLSAPARAVRTAVRELVQSTDLEGVHVTLGG